MIVAIDGTAGSGKSTTAKEVAARLGFLHLDSGALYRAFAYAARQAGWVGPDGDLPSDRIAELARQPVQAEARGRSMAVLLDGRPLAEELRAPEVSACASRISRHPEIREPVDRILRQLAAGHPKGVVCEGRDMGTVVFPHAELKVFMAAAPAERARRRLLQRGEEARGEAVREEARRLVERDAADSQRAVSPLRKAEDALVIDTTNLTFEEQVERIVAAAHLLDTS